MKFIIKGYADVSYTQHPETRRGASRNTATLNRAPVILKSIMQTTMKLSVTEAELDSSTMEVQDMLFVMEVVESMGLLVKKPIELHTDNKGVFDIANNWTVGGQTRHIATKCTFLRELKEANIIKFVLVSGETMKADLFTKILTDRHSNNMPSISLENQMNMAVK